MRSRSVRPRALTRVVWGFVAAVLCVGVTAGPALPAKEDVQEIGSLPVRYPKDVPHGASNASLIVNSALRRGYQFFYNEIRGITTGRIVDLDSQAVLVQKTMPRDIFPTGPLAPSTPQLAGEWIHTLNPETHELYLASADYSTVGGFAGIAMLDPFTLEVRKYFAQESFTYEPETVDPQDPSLPCIANSCLPQPPTLTAQLRGLAFAETILTGLTNKLLLLMQENSLPPPLEGNFNVAYVAQWDAETGNQDWIYRVQACGSSTFPGRDAGLFSLGIFQARLGSGIYIVCQASGATGQVVRIPVDGLNVPVPNGEQAFPGPQSVVDAISDPESDRMILRVQNEDGDSWWVFDGPSSSYTGVIGGTLSRVTAVAAGIDKTSGRLYMLVPPTLKDSQSSEGGLLMSDIRRSPAPQFLSFEQFAGQWEGAIQVDIHPESGERRIIALRKEALRYTILQDGVPISSDPPIHDRDRLTIDVEEEEGVTGRNFTGAGHAYGVRMLLTGGLEGFPPTGPDLGGIRVGRYAPMMVGSPCGTEGRELVIAAVDQTNLSNNITSAGASVGTADPGSRTDIGEPSARCYARPRDPDGNDVWRREFPVGIGSLQSRFGDYPQPHRTELDDEPTGKGTETKTDIDELAGNDWPFLPTQCSEDRRDSTFTRARPLDRGDAETGPVPPAQRQTEVDLEGFRAEVRCSLSGARVSGLAEIVAHEEQPQALEVDVPNLGTIRVGEASATTLIYLDPDRGLVSRSVSMARGIAIGDHVQIDAAFTIGEAWAAGRPGTAGTDFQRFLCGVRVKDQAPETHVYRPNPQVQPVPTEDPTSIDPTTLVDPNLQGGAEIQKGVSKSFCGDPNEPALGALKTYAGIDDKQPLIEIINRALGARGRASAPKPDGQLSQGTPGGYLASIQKDRLNEISSRSVNNDPSTQVPALEIVVFNDDKNRGRGRQTYQFAGVDASVTYGIFLLNPDEIFDPGCEPYCVEERIDDVLPPAPIEPFPVAPPPPARQGPITILFQGVNFLLRAPKEALLAAAVWAILFAPVQLASRRRSLRRLA